MDYLHACRKHVAVLMVKDTSLSALNKAFINGVRSCCDSNLLASLGAISNCVDFSVTLAGIMGRDQKAILLSAYASLVAPIRMPRVGKGCTQPQDVLLYMLAAFDARMNMAERIGANSASLAYLKLVEAMPEGVGAIGLPLAEIKASMEESLTNGVCATRESVAASIHDTLQRLGQKRWDGTLVPAKESQESCEDVPRSAYEVETSPESATTPSPTPAAGAAAGSSGANKEVCAFWASKTGCKYDRCKKLHPNGMKAKEPKCRDWQYDPNGCRRAGLHERRM